VQRIKKTLDSIVFSCWNYGYFKCICAKNKKNFWAPRYL